MSEKRVGRPRNDIPTFAATVEVKFGYPCDKVIKDLYIKENLTRRECADTLECSVFFFDMCLRYYKIMKNPKSSYRRKKPAKRVSVSKQGMVTKNGQGLRDERIILTGWRSNRRLAGCTPHEIMDLHWCDDLSLSEIAVQLNLCEKKVVRYFNTNNIPTKRGSMRAEDTLPKFSSHKYRDKLKETHGKPVEYLVRDLYLEQGLTRKECAEKLGCSYTFINKIINEYKLQKS